MNGRTQYKEIINWASNSTSDEIMVATIPTDRREQFWKYSDIPFQTIIELQNPFKPLQKNKAITMLSGSIDKVTLDHEINALPTDNFIKIGFMMKEHKLSKSMMEIYL